MPERCRPRRGRKSYATRLAASRRVFVRGQVEPLDVLRRHPGRAEARPELGDRLPHQRDPALRQPALVPLVVRGEHLLLEHRVERLRIGLVLLGLGRVLRRGAADREPAVRRVRLGPPAVEDRAVEHAVQRRLHPRGARRLERPPRRVEPDVDALHEPSRERHLVVLEEDDAPGRRGLPREVHDELDQILPVLVRRVRLPRDEHLDRALGIGEEQREPLGPAEEEARALVGREAAREADREDLGVELAHAARRGDELEQPLLRVAVRGPELLCRQLARALELRIRVAELHLELVGDPRPLVDAVRDRRDRDLVDALLGPEPVPHLARDGAVQLRDGVRVLRRAQRERREPEALLARLDLPEREEIVPGETAALDEAVEVPPHEVRVEHLVPRRNRRVRGEDGRRAQALECLAGRQSLLLHELAHALELEERRVPLVQVEDRRLEAEPPQHADAADAEHELLPQPVLAVAAVEDVRDVARPGRGSPRSSCRGGRARRARRARARRRAAPARDRRCRPRARRPAPSARARAAAGSCRCAGSARPAGRARRAAGGSSRGGRRARSRRAGHRAPTPP